MPIISANKKPDEYSEKINTEVEKKIAFLKQKKIEKTTIEKIAANMCSELEKFFNSKKDNEKLIQTTDSIFTESILTHYVQSNKPENSSDKSKLKIILDDLFNMQYNSNEHLKIEKTNDNETRFLTQKIEPLKVDAKGKSPTPNSEVLGVMHQKDHVTLYADKLSEACAEARASFYEAIFLQATHVGDFTSDKKGKLKLTKGTLSLLSLPENPDIKNEAIKHLAAFKKKYPSITLTYEHLAEADKAKLTLALKPEVTSAQQIAFDKPITPSHETAISDTGVPPEHGPTVLASDVPAEPDVSTLPTALADPDLNAVAAQPDMSKHTRNEIRLPALSTDEEFEDAAASVPTGSLAPAGLWGNLPMHNPTAAITTASETENRSEADSDSPARYSGNSPFLDSVRRQTEIAPPEALTPSGS